MKGYQLFVKTLASNGVDRIFSLSGNQIMPIFDACLDEGIRIIHVRHEAAAAYMAEAHARMTGGIGVALVTAGAGIGNAIAPLVTARFSQSPVLLISGDSPVAMDGSGSFQEMDQLGMTAAATKFAARITQPDQLVSLTRQAVEAATGGIPGPVHLSCPVDVISAEIDGQDFNDTAEAMTAVVPKPATEDVEGLAERLQQALDSARRPLILAGPALAMPCIPNGGYGAKLTALETKLQAPVLVMESPRGLNDPSLGAVKSLAAEADLVISLGKPVDFTLGFGSSKRFDPACRWLLMLADETSASQSAQNLAGRAVEITQLSPQHGLDLLSGLQAGGADRAAWCSKAADAIARRPFDRPTAALAGKPDSLSLCHKLDLLLQDDGLKQQRKVIAVSDGGEFGQWVQAMLKPDIRLINGVSGAIGGSLGYAMAAQLVCPDHITLALMGDGTVGFHFAEFETAAREQIPVIAIIGNDACWNAEVQIQKREFGPSRVFGCELSEARYDLAAAALGCHGEFVEDLTELEAALRRSIESGKPACINIRMDGLEAPTFTD